MSQNKSVFSRLSSVVVSAEKNEVTGIHPTGSSRAASLSSAVFVPKKDDLDVNSKKKHKKHKKKQKSRHKSKSADPSHDDACTHLVSHPPSKEIAASSNIEVLNTDKNCGDHHRKMFPKSSKNDVTPENILLKSAVKVPVRGFWKGAENVLDFISKGVDDVLDDDSIDEDEIEREFQELLKSKSMDSTLEVSTIETDSVKEPGVTCVDKVNLVVEDVEVKSHIFDSDESVAIIAFDGDDKLQLLKRHEKVVPLFVDVPDLKIFKKGIPVVEREKTSKSKSKSRRKSSKSKSKQMKRLSSYKSSRKLFHDYLRGSHTRSNRSQSVLRVRLREQAKVFLRDIEALTSTCSTSFCDRRENEHGRSFSCRISDRYRRTDRERLHRKSFIPRTYQNPLNRDFDNSNGHIVESKGRRRPSLPSHEEKRSFKRRITSSLKEPVALDSITHKEADKPGVVNVQESNDLNTGLLERQKNASVDISINKHVGDEPDVTLPIVTNEEGKKKLNDRKEAFAVLNNIISVSTDSQSSTEHIIILDCHLCNLTFASLEELSAHYISLEHCEQVERLKRHRQRQVSSITGRCLYCNVSFDNPIRVRNHLQTEKHKNNVFLRTKFKENLMQSLFCSPDEDEPAPSDADVALLSKESRENLITLVNQMNEERKRKELTGLLSPHDFSDEVQMLVMQQFVSVCEQMNPALCHWGVLSGIVMTRPGHSPLVICVTTGTKCISGNELDQEGMAVNDCHAEILARRCFQVFLYSQLQLLQDPIKANDSIFERCEDPDLSPYELKRDVNFHLYVHSAPCGDARLFIVKDFAAQSSDVDDRRNARSRGLLRVKVENAIGGQPSLCETTANQTWEQLGKGGRLRTMCCSDKVCLWNVCGAQGALLSYLINPIYFKSIILGSIFNKEHFYRAIVDRVDDIRLFPTKYVMPERYFVHKPMLACTTTKYIPLGGRKPPNLSICWLVGDEQPELLICTKGRLYMDRPSRLSKWEMFNKFIELHDALSPSKRGHDFTKMSYGEVKRESMNYMSAKTTFQLMFSEKQMGYWIKKPFEIDDFYVSLSDDSLIIADSLAESTKLSSTTLVATPSVYPSNSVDLDTDIDVS